MKKLVKLTPAEGGAAWINLRQIESIMVPRDKSQKGEVDYHCRVVMKSGNVFLVKPSEATRFVDVLMTEHQMLDDKI